MTDLKTLQRQIANLEAKLKMFADDQIYMTALYEKAKELVLKHQKSSVIFLQKKLLIDYHRASQILEELRLNGIIK